ncbi:(2Z,6Z)-farnesyl diphosphate synthase CPT6, chloroplastic-like [Salvia hispanica]|uniref:(2Z,6Z)-farnesyl diphosphate synthase CPT6, chloroplastic-like n=1 Tax=Salvia hispanica TaxID=49212 RepID=UPI0020095E04|nr:(2Z,6Z)-farnesyl diphosphate synthase CPT6, chloroplastic-like [Salvia hispanica]
MSSLNPCRATKTTTGEWPSSARENGVIRLRGELNQEFMPKHVALIMDGNGRWAKNKGLAVQEGHKSGRINLKYLTYNCSNLGIKMLTAYAFSTENWNRSKMEVAFLMTTFEEFIQSLVEDLMARHDIRFSAIGEKSRLSKSLQCVISRAEEMSRSNKGLHFVMAMSYSGRNDVVEAAKNIAAKVECGIVETNEIDEAMLEQELMTNIGEFPNPDLLIRTSGELRLSNFLLWQLVYSQFYFSDKLFPDFGEKDLLKAIASYQSRASAGFESDWK